MIGQLGNLTELWWWIHGCLWYVHRSIGCWGYKQTIIKDEQVRCPMIRPNSWRKLEITTVSRLSLLGLGVWGFGSHLLVTWYLLVSWSHLLFVATTWSCFPAERSGKRNGKLLTDVLVIVGECWRYPHYIILYIYDYIYIYHPASLGLLFARMHFLRS